MKNLLIKIINFIIATINLIAAILTIVLPIIDDKYSWTFMICFWGLILVASICYMKWMHERTKIRALRILAHRGKVNTINFMAYLDFLEHKYRDDYDNNPKTNNLIVTKSIFTFHFYNNCQEKFVDVDYLHTLHITKHKNRFDVLILHAHGELIRETKYDVKPNNLFPYILYQNKYYYLIPQPCLGDIKNRNNQILDRIQCPLPSMNMKEETLTIHYRINKGFYINDGNVFVIYPQNYGKKFTKESTLQLTFEHPYFAEIQLLTLPYNGISDSGLQYVAQFENENQEGKKYFCKLKSLKAKNIYLIYIKHKTLV